MRLSEHDHSHSRGQDDKSETVPSIQATEVVTVDTQEVVEAIEMEGIEEGDLVCSIKVTVNVIRS